MLAGTCAGMVAGSAKPRAARGRIGQSAVGGGRAGVRVLETERWNAGRGAPFAAPRSTPRRPGLSRPTTQRPAPSAQHTAPSAERPNVRRPAPDPRHECETGASTTAPRSARCAARSHARHLPPPRLRASAVWVPAAGVTTVLHACVRLPGGWRRAAWRDKTRHRGTQAPGRPHCAQDQDGARPGRATQATGHRLLLLLLLVFWSHARTAERKAAAARALGPRGRGHGPRATGHGLPRRGGRFWSALDNTGGGGGV